MRLEPGFVQCLRDDIRQIDTEYLRRINRSGGLTTEKLVELVSLQREHDLGSCDHVEAMDVTNYDDISFDEQIIGEKAINDGEVAFVVLAGGKGTRVGGSKAFLKLPQMGLSLANLKCVQASCSTSNDKTLTTPIWFMVAAGTLDTFSAHLNTMSPVPTGCIFEQFESIRLGPDNRVIFVERGIPDVYPTGHGDVGPSLVESNVLADNPTIKYCVVANIDNTTASIDPKIIGRHIKSNNVVTCEVVNREKDDSGGFLVWTQSGRAIVEATQLLPEFSKECMYTNTNTTVINVDALRNPVDWRWVRVRKHVDNKIVVQYERFLNQYTHEYNKYDNIEYVCVKRPDRYLPIKVPNDAILASAYFNGNKRWGLR
jgi:UDP-N-acetylglucosamine pyrophosphorylase